MVGQDEFLVPGGHEDDRILGGQKYLDIAGRQRHAFNEKVFNKKKRISTDEYL